MSKKQFASNPLADRIRPTSFDQLVGQDHILGEGKPLRKMVEDKRIPSMILWGPPGSGKTTIAGIIAEKIEARFKSFSAVLSSIKEVKELMKEARSFSEVGGKPFVVFIDEIHRFNKAQQDAFLPYVEEGSIVLIGATTENPSFEVISPLLSRCRVFLLNPLEINDTKQILERALNDPDDGLGSYKISVDDKVLERIAILGDGDARRSLNILDLAFQAADVDGQEALCITPELVQQVAQTKSLHYDKAGEEHYNLISALHKSLRNSDADAALYWLGRMLEAGEDPLYIARRMVRFASEDVGMADPHALTIAMRGRDAVHFIGLPEGDLALAEVAVYLALAPKSNSLYAAFGKVKEDINRLPNEPVPFNIRNAPTKLMKGLGYGKDYKYAHNYEEGTTDMDCLPENLKGRRYYNPTTRGKEKRYKEILESLEQVRNKKRK